MKAVVPRNSESPSLSTWNGIVSIIGVPLGAMLSLIAIILTIKHHREARRHGEASRGSHELVEMPVQNARDINVQTEPIDISNEICRSESRYFSKITSSPVRASTYPGIHGNVRSWNPARAVTYNSTMRYPCDVSLPPDSAARRSLDPNRASQITLLDEDEFNNPTMIITYPSAAYANPTGHIT